MSREELGSLVRALREQIEWQAGPNATLVRVANASTEARDIFEEHIRLRTRQEIAKSRHALETEHVKASPSASQPSVSASGVDASISEVSTEVREKLKDSNVQPLWKTIGSRPKSTFEKKTQDATPTQTLEAIRAELGDCRRCGLCDTRTQIVFGVGSENARIVVVGEAPGENEDKQGEPFVGKAGALLDKMIGAMGLSREEIYIANVLKCRPSQNRDPSPEEVLQCSPFLKKQIQAIQPDVIIAMGKFASNLLTNHQGSLSAIRGRWHEYEGIALMPTYHPAYLLRDPNRKREAWADLKKVMQKLGL